QSIRRIGVDGIITTVAGISTVLGDGGDGGPATLATLFHPSAVSLGADGSLYIADRYNRRIRRVTPDGIITTIAGTGAFAYGGDGGLATQAQLANVFGVALGADGNLYIADMDNYRIRVVKPPFGGSVGGASVASEDGREVYVFDGHGRHVRTVDAFTGGIRYQFAYDGAGRLL